MQTNKSKNSSMKYQSKDHSKRKRGNSAYNSNTKDPNPRRSSIKKSMFDLSANRKAEKTNIPNDFESIDDIREGADFMNDEPIAKKF
jgi:hypothetical protein